MTRYTVRPPRTQRFSVQPRTGFGEGAVDPTVSSMQAALKAMGISQIRVLDGKEGYQALDQRGLVKYQWQTVDELIAQIRGEDDMGKELKERIERGIVKVSMAGGRVGYDVTTTVDGKSKYGGRFSTVEEARAKRDSMRKPKRATIFSTPATHPGGRPTVVIKATVDADKQVVSGDRLELVRLFNEWQAAKQEYATAWFKTDELRQALDEKVGALKSFLEAHGKVER